MTAKPFPKLEVVRPRRLYEQIALQIESLIRSERLRPGARLPGERELAERLGVSRPSLREALIALETAGLIEVRPGGGGTHVRKPARAGKVFSFGDDVDLGPGPLEQFEARKAVETACAELAAKYATGAQIEALEASLARMGKAIAAGRNPAEEHRLFHTLLAEASSNSILAGAVRELWRLRQEKMWDLLRVRVENEESWRLGLAFRHALIERLRRRDAAGARAAIEAHFARLARLYFEPAD